MAIDLSTIRSRLRGKVALAFAGVVAVLALASAAALVLEGSATGATATMMAVPRLQGTIGPGFTISLSDRPGAAPQGRPVHLRRCGQVEHPQLHAQGSGSDE
jgi:hypothetical protein